MVGRKDSHRNLDSNQLQEPQMINHFKYKFLGGHLLEVLHYLRVKK